MTVSPSLRARRLAPLSTLIPGMIPLASSSWGNGDPLRRALAHGLVEEDDPADELVGGWGGEEQVAIAAAVLLRRLDVDRVEPLLDRPAALVRREDALAGSDERAGRVVQCIVHWMALQVSFGQAPPSAASSRHRRPELGEAWLASRPIRIHDGCPFLEEAQREHGTVGRPAARGQGRDRHRRRPGNRPRYRRRLVEMGAKVVVVSRTAADVEETCSQISSLGSIEAAPCDVSDRNAAKGLIRDVRARHGALDMLVCSHGVYDADSPFLDLSEEQWDRTIGINLTGNFTLAQTAARTMVADKNPGRYRLHQLDQRHRLRARVQRLQHQQGRLARVREVDRLRPRAPRHHGQRRRARLGALADVGAVPERGIALWPADSGST